MTAHLLSEVYLLCIAGSTSKRLGCSKSRQPVMVLGLGPIVHFWDGGELLETMAKPEQIQRFRANAGWPNPKNSRIPTNSLPVRLEFVLVLGVDLLVAASMSWPRKPCGLETPGSIGTVAPTPSASALDNYSLEAQPSSRSSSRVIDRCQAQENVQLSKLMQV